ncbi:Monoacylglycerol lipase ABHD12 [Oryzias melastigma]|uniref:Monoacylglycerol lipase ABHD12 n=1 Tax=Oryzias melastigma TaxID=30732 RepID=A0A834F8R5_ORYME|nr:Monoacylglycerol lipase ABHD12 [Oryzias melastigma]
MKRRNVKQKPSASKPNRTRNSGRKEKKERFHPWIKWGLLAAFVVFIAMPVTLIVMPEIIQQLVYKYRLKVPFFVDLSRPADFSLNHTINMYLTTEEGISLGVWHTVPAHRWEEAQGKDLAWYQNSLNDGSPVFIYFHGNTLTRAALHRVGVAKLLSALGYHVVVPDYRGFGDSTGEPSESGLTTDAIYLYNWVKARSGDSLVVIWGHSLGTGSVSDRYRMILSPGYSRAALLNLWLFLFGSFLAILDFVFLVFKYYCKLPSLETLCYMFAKPLANDKIMFPSEQNLKKMKSPILFLHSEDDHLVPIEIAHQTYEVAAKAQSSDRVKLVTFDGSLGYLHNGLYRDPKLPGIIKTVRVLAALSGKLRSWQSDDVAEGCGRCAQFLKSSFNLSFCMLIARGESRDWLEPMPCQCGEHSRGAYAIGVESIPENCLCHTTRKKEG